jgi:hypothetical protein
MGKRRTKKGAAYLNRKSTTDPDATVYYQPARGASLAYKIGSLSRITAGDMTFDDYSVGGVSLFYDKPRIAYGSDLLLGVFVVLFMLFPTEISDFRFVFIELQVASAFSFVH